MQGYKIAEKFSLSEQRGCYNWRTCISSQFQSKSEHSFLHHSREIHMPSKQGVLELKKVDQLTSTVKGSSFPPSETGSCPAARSPADCSQSLHCNQQNVQCKHQLGQSACMYSRVSTVQIWTYAAPKTFRESCNIWQMLIDLGSDELHRDL